MSINKISSSKVFLSPSFPRSFRSSRILLLFLHLSLFLIKFFAIMGLDHWQIEERSLALHREIAQRLRENPALLEIARGNLNRWIQSQGDRLYWTEWKKILNSPLNEIFAFLVSPEDKARWLRQSSPFCGILTPQERWKIYESFST